jgi:hypothetical protein
VEDDCTLVVYETTFTFKEWRSIDSGVEPPMMRMIEDEVETRYPRKLSPQVYDPTSRTWSSCPR